MVVDEDNLTVIINSLRALVAANRERIVEGEKLATVFSKIALVDGSNPVDPDTGVTMTQTRRNDIYDNCIPIANNLLGITTS